MYNRSGAPSLDIPAEASQDSEIGQKQPREQQSVASPPPPFRTSPWFDPKLVSQPDPVLKRRAAATVFVILGGVVLPLISLLMNFILERVVALGWVGGTALCFSVVSVLANLLLFPTRKDDYRRTVLLQTPRSTALCIVLFVGAMLSSLFWAYLALLFLPLFPLSIIAIVVLGLGLCGLCPYGALLISVIQSVRAGRVVWERLGRAWTTGLVVSTLLIPLLAAAGAGLYVHARDKSLEQIVTRIAKTPPYSARRMSLIDHFERGEETRIVYAYQRERDHERRRILAEIYQRLTDKPLTFDATHTMQRSLIRPWWFMERDISPLGFNVFEPTRSILSRGF